MEIFDYKNLKIDLDMISNLKNLHSIFVKNEYIINRSFIATLLSGSLCKLNDTIIVAFCKAEINTYLCNQNKSYKYLLSIAL